MDTIDIQSFLNYFSENMIYSYIKVPTISPAHGIHFLYPAPAQGNGTVFLGTFSEWSSLEPGRDLQEGCTYIITADNDSVPTEQPWDGRNLNLLFVRSNLPDTLLAIRSFFESHREHFTEDQQQLLVNFFKEISSQKADSTKIFQYYYDRFPYPLKTFIAVIVLKPSRNFHSPVSEITQQLSVFFPETNLFYYEKEWIIFYSQAEQASGHINIAYQDFSDLLASFHL